MKRGREKTQNSKRKVKKKELDVMNERGRNKWRKKGKEKERKKKRKKERKKEEPKIVEKLPSGKAN